MSSAVPTTAGAAVLATRFEMGTHHAAAVQGLIPFGSRSGQRVQLFGDPPEAPPPGPYEKLCADHEGYSLNAAVRVAAGNRIHLEKLARYVTRPALAQDPLQLHGSRDRERQNA